MNKLASMAAVFALAAATPPIRDDKDHHGKTADATASADDHRDASRALK